MKTGNVCTVLIEQKYLDQVYYDPSVNSKLRRTKTGKEVICNSTVHHGYHRVSILDKKFLVSHIVYALHYGAHKLIGNCIDHLNGTRSDNRIENLDVTPPERNSRNKGEYSNNTSGKTGVSFSNTHNKWLATWNNPITGKEKSKGFPIKKHGDNAFKMACDYRLMIEETLLKNHGYSDRHGK